MTDVTDTARNLIFAAAALSLATVLGAYFFEYVVGLPPCALCWWQRYAHFAFLALIALAAVTQNKIVTIGALLAALTSVGIAGFHTGVEREWWPGLASCSAVSEDLSAVSATDLLAVGSAPAIVRCDEIPWTFAGLSMANYNVMISLVLAGLCLMALKRLSGR